MVERYRVKWTREETILAFDLYCRTPFSKISKSNKDIIELAKLLGRTPSSVSLKMGNLAHYDPEVRARNLSGMAHGSNLDQVIWKEFSDNWEDLSYQAQLLLSKKKQTTIERLIELPEIESFPAGEYTDRMIRTRVGQYFFRMSVLTSYSNRCCITGLYKPELLIASHIKPWKDSDSKTERTNPSNGLCLNALHDKAFDRGFITIDSNYKIIISKRLKDIHMDDDTKTWFESYDNKSIVLPDKFLPGREFIKYHNDVVFQG